MHPPPEPGVCLWVLASLPACESAHFQCEQQPSSKSALGTTAYLSQEELNSMAFWKVSESGPRADHFCCLLSMLYGGGRDKWDRQYSYKDRLH